MKEDFEKELQRVSSNFNEWTNILREYVELKYDSEKEEAIDEGVGVSLKLHGIFETLLKLYSMSRNFKDVWEFPVQMDITPLGQQACLRAKKTQTKFDFGIYYDEFYLQSYIEYPSYIRSMDDEFWSHFIALQSLGHFEFVENAWPASSEEADKAEKQLKNTKSNIFRIIRNYIVLELYEGNSVDLGTLEIKWPITTSWETIIRNGASAFDRIYGINAMLCRARRLQEKSKKTIKGSLR